MTPEQKTDVLPGTRALMVLKTLDLLGRRIEQMSGHLLTVNQGALHPVFPKLEQQGANTFCGGASENNRRAGLTREGRKPFQVELTIGSKPRPSSLVSSKPTRRT